MSPLPTYDPAERDIEKNDETGAGRIDRQDHIIISGTGAAPVDHRMFLSLVFLFILSFSVPLLSNVVFNHELFHETINNQTKNQLIMLASMIEQQFSMNIEKELRSLNSFSAMGNTANMIMALNAMTASPDGAIHGANTEEDLLSTQLQNLSSRTGSSRLIITNMDGFALASITDREQGRPARHVVFLGKRVHLKTVAREARKTGSGICTDINIDNPNKDKQVFYIYFVLTDEEGKQIGIAIDMVDDSLMKTLFAKGSFGSVATESILVDNNFQVLIGTMLTDSFPKQFSKVSNASEKFRFAFDYDWHGEKCSGVLTPLSSNRYSTPNWFIMTQIPQRSSIRAMAAYRHSTWLFVGLCTVPLLLFIIFLNKKIVTPLARYQNWAQMAADGRITDLEPPSGDSEIDRFGMALASVAARMKDVVSFSTAASLGSFSRSFPQKDAEDSLGKGMNGIRNYFLSILKIIKDIVNGKYRVDDSPDSVLDELRPHINQLANVLYLMNEDNLRQIAHSYTQTELIRQITGEQNLTALSDRILSFICQCFKARLGILYVRDKDTDYFTLTANYGHIKQDVPPVIKEGEGLCGQAIHTKKHQITTRSQSYSRQLFSGLVESTAYSILTYPFLFGNEVIAVMELGSMDEFKTEYLDFLKKNNETISIGIHSSITRNLTERLLEKTIDQSSRMAIQQEKLKNANIELEARASALKESESRLMLREEELKKVNKALEAHSIDLEKQKQILDMKNRELEETKSVLENKAIELAKSNSYKSEFLANMSHELRTPLNSIILLSSLLANDEKKNIGNKIEFAKLINQSGKDLLNLIEEVLDLTKISTGKIALAIGPHPISDCEKDILRAFKAIAHEKNIEFTTTIHEGLPEYIVTDSTKLDRILKNILSNAFKYTKEGRILFDIKRPDAETHFRSPHIVSTQTVEFTITDTGEGIPETMVDLVFEAFKQVDGSITRKHGGVGLGLSIANELARLLHGEIQLKSELGRGSRFSLFLPETWNEAWNEEISGRYDYNYSG